MAEFWSADGSNLDERPYKSGKDPRESLPGETHRLLNAGSFDDWQNGGFSDLVHRSSEKP